MIPLVVAATLTGYRGTVAAAAGTHASAPASRAVLRADFLPMRPAGVTLAGLSRGAVGAGALVLYTANRGPNRPSVVVVLTHAAAGGNATARVYAAPPGVAWVPLRLAHGRVTIEPGLSPALILRAQGGYWRRDGHPNYNLDVQVFGPVQAMWGSGPESGTSLGYVGELKPGELGYDITIRAQADGTPAWDLRQLVPPFPGEGFYRTNYAQRECPGHPAWGPTVERLWPYVSTSRGFLEPSGVIEPPIVVDWATGKVTMFGEVVSVRSERCSYDFYSLTRLRPGRVNRPDFESPWGLYDLSGQDRGLPSLIIRTQHFPSNDPWSTGDDPALLQGAPLDNRPTEDIRYSWADHPGNQLFNYKVDVYGDRAYPDVVSIAGGSLRVRAPAYAQYPGWVVDHRWPSTTFIDTNGGDYATSEGIYQWPAQSIGTRYWRGWSSRPRLSDLGGLLVGLRGEYRVGSSHRPWLYASNVDLRLHLLDAQGGLWNLGGGAYLVEGNLTGGPHIDSWTLERFRPSAVVVPHDKAPHRVVSALDELDGFLLYSGPHGVTLRRAAGLHNGLRVLPPTDHATWLRFVAAVRPYRVGRNPRHLSTWIAAFSGPSASWSRATLRDVTATSTGFSAVLTAAQGGVVQQGLPGLSVPGPGRWLLIWNRSRGGQWRIVPARGPAVHAVIIVPLNARALRPTHLRLLVTNEGNVPWAGTLWVITGSTTLYENAASVAGTGRLAVRLPWSPPAGGLTRVVVLAAGQRIGGGSVVVHASPRPGAARLFAVSGWDGWDTAMGAVLLGCVAVGFAWRRGL